MNEFKKDIQKPTEEEKKTKMVDIIVTIINSDLVLSFEELENYVKEIRKKLSEDEITAIYNLAVYLKKSIITSRYDNRLNEFLNISNYCQNDEGNLLKFINAVVTDIEKTREIFPERKWELQIDKIFDRMEGKNPYEDEIKVMNYRKENIKMVEK